MHYSDGLAKGMYMHGLLQSLGVKRGLNSY